MRKGLSVKSGCLATSKARSATTTACSRSEAATVLLRIVRGIAMDKLRLTNCAFSAPGSTTTHYRQWRTEGQAVLPRRMSLIMETILKGHTDPPSGGKRGCAADRLLRVLVENLESGRV